MEVAEAAASAADTVTAVGTGLTDPPGASPMATREKCFTTRYKVLHAKCGVFRKSVAKRWSNGGTTSGRSGSKEPEKCFPEPVWPIGISGGRAMLGVQRRQRPHHRRRGLICDPCRRPIRDRGAHRRSLISVVRASA